MRHFQRTYEKPESVVDELFEATTDRLWALTSKEEGVYEFEVVSLREYFAARFLYKFAGEGDRDFDSAIVFRELLRRPYWLNTARFYSGNAHGKEIYRSEEHTSELQSLMRISYAVFCLKKNTQTHKMSSNEK